jgi:hypothetical protein
MCSSETSHGTQGFMAVFAQIYLNAVMPGGMGFRRALSVAEHKYAPPRIYFV